MRAQANNLSHILLDYQNCWCWSWCCEFNFQWRQFFFSDFETPWCQFCTRMPEMSDLCYLGKTRLSFTCMLQECWIFRVTSKIGTEQKISFLLLNEWERIRRWTTKSSVWLQQRLWSCTQVILPFILLVIADCMKLNLDRNFIVESQRDDLLGNNGFLGRQKEMLTNRKLLPETTLNQWLIDPRIQTIQTSFSWYAFLSGYLTYLKLYRTK